MNKAYFTGKVWIGSAYFPDNRPLVQGDALLIQKALLEAERPKMNTAQDWNTAYINGGLRRKRDFDYIMPEPTDTTRMKPELDDYASKIFVGGLIAVCLAVILGILIAEWLS